MVMGVHIAGMLLGWHRRRIIHVSHATHIADTTNIALVASDRSIVHIVHFTPFLQLTHRLPFHHQTGARLHYCRFVAAGTATGTFLGL